MRDCCPSCRTNQFVNAASGGYSIVNASKPKQNGVRFIYTLQGAFVPVARKNVCHNPACPDNVAKLNQRKLKWENASLPLPSQAAAPDGKPWPRTIFSTSGDAFIKLLAEVAPHVASPYQSFTLFASGAGACDSGLAAKLMDTTGTHAAVRRDILAGAKERERRMLLRYIAFADAQAHTGSTPAAAHAATTLMPTSREDVSNPVVREFLEDPPERSHSEATATVRAMPLRCRARHPQRNARSTTLAIRSLTPVDL